MSTGLCECGCGQATTIAKRNDPRDDIVKGQPYRFIRGHHARLRPLERCSNAAGGREQARRLYPDPLGPCEAEGCVKPAIERHHRDDDPCNNERSNLAFLCRRHHMEFDGRLARLRTLAKGRGPDAPRDWHGRYAAQAARDAL